MDEEAADEAYERQLQAHFFSERDTSPNFWRSVAQELHEAARIVHVEWRAAREREKQPGRIRYVTRGLYLAPVFLMLAGMALEDAIKAKPRAGRRALPPGEGEQALDRRGHPDPRQARASHGSVARYHCLGAHINHGLARNCVSFGGLRVDEAVEREVLRVVAPGAIEAALAAAEASGEASDAARRAVELELRQARYEADRARRQYDAAEPEHRLVVDTLERRWNDALAQVAIRACQSFRVPKVLSESVRTPVIASSCPVCRAAPLRGRQTACSPACRRRRSREREMRALAARDQEVPAVLEVALRKLGESAPTKAAGRA